MHICFLCSEYPPCPHGGIGTVTQVLGRALAARGHVVTVVGFYRVRRDSVEDNLGVTVIRLACARVRGARAVLNGRRLRQTLQSIDRRRRIDVIEGSELSLALLPRTTTALKAIRMHGGHHFFYVTLGHRPRPWRSWLEARSFARADALCAVSQFVAEKTRELLCLGARPIEILPNPVETDLFDVKPDVPEEPGRLMFVGTVCEKKGIRQLIQAMPKILREVPHARLWIAGRDWKDPAGRSFTRQLQESMPPEVAEHVEFLGAVPHSELPPLMARASVCVYPSHMEAMGLTLAEALAMGKAMVASRTGPGPELVEDGITGVLCDPHDPESIASKVVLLLRNPELRRQLGVSARRRALERFSISALVRRNEEFYQAQLEARRAR
jgi:glycosyltransferase involved in cell wall biosynthesis